MQQVGLSPNSSQSNSQLYEKKSFSNQEKPKDVRKGNIIAAKALADIVRTSLGPKGMDKMIRDNKGEVTITNDGATILKQLQVVHPTAKMLVEISKAQDIEAGDGTTSVVIIAGSLLNAAQTLLDRGIHPTTITEGFQYCCDQSEKIIDEIAKKINLTDRESLIQNCITSLSSKVVSQYSQILAPIAVESVLKLVNNGALVNNEIDLRDVKVSKLIGGTIEDTEMVDGLVFTHNKISHSAGGPSRIENPKIALIQFCVSSPKTDMENTVVVNEYSAMDRILKEERKYIIDIVKKIKASGCNVLLIQKSILRDATNDLSLHFLAKAGIMVIKDIDREEIEFISNTINATPVAHIDHLTPNKLGKAILAEEISMSDGSKLAKISGKIKIISGVPNNQKTVSILVRGSNHLLLDEAERSLHDALCVMRSRMILAGGGAPEIELSYRLQKLSLEQTGLKSYCVRAYGEALEIIPYTLAENAGLNPIDIVTELRTKHANGETYCGINVKKGSLTNMFDENVIQPALVTISALKLATEVVRMILKIDDIVVCR